MTKEILLALAASIFTATASVAQRAAAATAPKSFHLSWRLFTYLPRRPMWFFGILCMIAGFGFQLAALHYGDLSLVEPVIASELLFVFAYLAIRHRGVRRRDLVAAIGMAGSLGSFLYLAHPRGGSVAHATAVMWVGAGAAVVIAAAATAGASGVRRLDGAPPTPGRQAALLGVSAGIAWGFVAAVIKELSAHLGGGTVAVFTNWAPYVLLGCGAVAMFLVSNAFQAGPLAASQPGLTIVDPLVAILLGVTLFGEHIQTGTLHVIGEVVLFLILVGSVLLLSGSPLIRAGREPDEQREIEAHPFHVRSRDELRPAPPGEPDEPAFASTPAHPHEGGS